MVGASSSWWDPWLAFLLPTQVTLGQLATLNPSDPALPLASILLEALDPKTYPAAAAQVATYMVQKLTYYQFTLFCVCNPNPAGSCYSQPVMAGPHNGYFTATHTYGVDFTNTNAGAILQGFRWWSIATGGGGTTVYLWTTSGTLLHSWPVSICGSGVSDCTVSLSPTYTLAAATTYRIGFDISGVQGWGYEAAGSITANPNWAPVDSYASPSGTTGTFPNASQGGLWWDMGPQVCVAGSSTPPPSPSSPSQPTQIHLPPILSCGTTADLCTAVRQLDQRLTQIYQLLTFTQRTGVPFAYVPGAVHSGLTGVGSFAISQLIGARVQLVSTATGQPILPGNPPYLWNQGWLSVNDSNGMLEEKRLTRSGQEWFPRFCQMATSFNYDLAAGVSMNVTELYAET
jgi:hypothetical protein